MAEEHLQNADRQRLEGPDCSGASETRHAAASPFFFFLKKRVCLPRRLDLPQQLQKQRLIFFVSEGGQETTRRDVLHGRGEEIVGCGEERQTTGKQFLDVRSANQLRKEAQILRLRETLAGFSLPG